MAASAKSDNQTDGTGSTLSKADLENFPVAPGFLPAAWRTDLMAVYGFARLVDDTGDGDLADPAGTARLLGVTPAEQPDETVFRLAMLDGLERDLDRAFEAALPGAAGEPPRHPLLRALVPLVRRHEVEPEPFRRLIEANRVDQVADRYPTYQDLLEYCTLSADPVGRLVLALAGVSTPERIALSDAVCTALQIVEHLQDVAEDLARGRIYLPGEDLEKFGVTEAMLAEPTAGPQVRALVAFEVERARTLLDRGAPLVGTVRGRLRLLLAGFTAGGYAALAAIETAGYDVLATQAKPDKRRLAVKAATLFAKGR
ncbi:squalene synthase [Kitasatospora sp. MMS16-BH015]|uniref:squalene synthase HpnC n=1 Tax=Kitasatospora sp. MMS16-BH015 TaxID=2018025 RepID=UPI000CA14C56|nr:squalene synthase HpnC [Kitasatospora sp. MMS16-BH015]AUG81229.1 squalene synthase [Kitasatospora sp. MMS16-BH015]